jgi:2-polyprenyl-3-methyl-5-hydroxy-6-metoxy-1,4-benzoquinol methylase
MATLYNYSSKNSIAAKFYFPRKKFVAAKKNPLYILQKFHRKAKKMQWFENEDFWLNYAPVMFDSQHWAQARGTAEAIKKLGGLNDGAEVLDFCCGPGRISVELAILGFRVTGVDIMQKFLDAARESAEDENVQIDFLNCDMRNFSSQKKFDCAVNVYNSFGYCDSMGEDMKILQNASSALKKGGVLILECISRETAVKFFTEGEWFERNGMTVLTDFSVEGAWEGLRSKWILLDKNGNRREHCFVQRLYPAAELRDMIVKNCGFSCAQVFGGFNGEKYDQNAQTMVILARK